MQPITIHVEVSLSEATISALQQLAAQGIPATVQPAAPAPAPAPAPVIKVETRKAAPAEAPAPAPAPQAPERTVSAAQLREALGEAQTLHGVPAGDIRAMLTGEFNVAATNQLTDAQRVEFISKLQALWRK